MKYIDADKLIAEIEKRQEYLGDHNFHSMASEYDWLLTIVQSLQQEQPMPDSTKLIELWHADKEMLKEKDFRNDPWRLAYNAFMCGFGRGLAVNKQEQPEGNLEYWLEHFGMPKENIDNCITQIAQGYGACRYLEGIQHGAEAVNELAKQEQPEVDLEKELDRYLRGEFQQTAGGNFINYIQIARHFYKLGLNARKEEKK